MPPVSKLFSAPSIVVVSNFVLCLGNVVTDILPLFETYDSELGKELAILKLLVFNIFF